MELWGTYLNYENTSEFPFQVSRFFGHDQLYDRLMKNLSFDKQSFNTFVMILVNSNLFSLLN